MEKTKFRKLDGRKCQYLDENGKWKSTGKDTIEEAKMWYFTKHGSQGITFRDFTENFFTDTSEGSYLYMIDVLEKDISKEHIYISETILKKHIIPYFGKMPIDAITPVIVQDWYNNLKGRNGKKLKASSAQKIVDVLSTVFKWALFRGVVQSNPVKYIMKRSVQNDGRQPFTNYELNIMFPNDIDKVISIWGSKIYALYFLILRDTGWRPGEILGLTPFDIIHEDKAIKTSKTFNTFENKVKYTIKTSKTGAKFKIGLLSDITYNLLVDVIKDLNYDQQIFVDKFGNNYTYKKMLYQFHCVLKELGIDSEGRPQYALRTTFMTNIANTMSDDNVMLLMGHKQWRSCYDQRQPEQVIKKIKNL